jgi:glycosyltransferase involved in cell wall biosynthesis
MRHIRVCIDGTPLLLRSAGVKTYVYHWVRSLIDSAGPHQLTVFPFVRQIGACDHERSMLGRWPTLGRLAVLHAANYLGNFVLAPLGRSADVFHASHQLRNPPRGVRITATLYDMTCWLVPEMHSAANVAAGKLFAERVLKRADALIAISENTRQDAVRILGLSPEKIHVIYPGVAEAYFQPSEFSAVKYGLSRPYALFVGTVEPRKNVMALLDAYERLSRAEFDLAVAGPAGWGDRSALQRLQSGIPGVRYLGYVPEEDLPGLTRGATVFVYPSLYEGFGLPVAQAMAAGVPVITSRVSSLPEITGDSALLVDPRSPAEIRAALEKLLGSPSLRSELGQRAALRARRYKWTECARRSWKLFENLCGLS